MLKNPNYIDKTAIPDKVERYIDLKWKSQLFDSQLSFKIKPQNKNKVTEPSYKLGSGNESDVKNDNLEGSEDLTPR